MYKDKAQCCRGLLIAHSCATASRPADPTLQTYLQAFRKRVFGPSIQTDARTHTMSRFVSSFVAALLNLCWQHVLVDGVYVEVPVQLAVSGDDFSSFGTINGDLLENVSLNINTLFTVYLPSDVDEVSRCIPSMVLAA